MQKHCTGNETAALFYFFRGSEGVVAVPATWRQPGLPAAPLSGLAARRLASSP